MRRRHRCSLPLNFRFDHCLEEDRGTGDCPHLQTDFHGAAPTLGLCSACAGLPSGHGAPDALGSTPSPGDWSEGPLPDTGGHHRAPNHKHLRSSPGTAVPSRLFHQRKPRPTEVHALAKATRWRRFCPQSSCCPTAVPHTEIYRTAITEALVLPTSGSDSRIPAEQSLAGNTQPGRGQWCVRLHTRHTRSLN